MTDGRTDGRTKTEPHSSSDTPPPRQTDRRTDDGRTDGRRTSFLDTPRLLHTDRQMTGRRTDGRAGGRADGRTDRLTDRQMDSRHNIACHYGLGQKTQKIHQKSTHKDTEIIMHPESLCLWCLLDRSNYVPSRR